MSNYSVDDYGGMVADGVRVAAYARALESAITPGAVVLEIGTGALGMFAMLACRYGARRVYAIEPDDGIELAREIARTNGFGDRIVFIHDLSTRVALPEKADVSVSDMRGVLPLYERHVPSIKDARERLVSPGAIMIPHEDRVWVAVAEAAKNYERYDKPWRGRAYGLDLKPGLKIVTNTWRKGRVTPEQLLTEPARWATIQYQTVESADVRGEVQLRVTRGGTAHGLSLWFDSTLVEGVELTNAPGAPETLYGQAFFPLSEPVDVTPGDVVSAAISATLVGEDYIWRWDTRIASGGRPAAVKAAFSQSNFFGTPLSHARLRKRAASHVPSANLDGEILRHVLARFGSQKSLQEIAEELVERFPERFGDRRQALEVAADVSEKYGQ